MSDPQLDFLNQDELHNWMSVMREVRSGCALQVLRGYRDMVAVAKLERGSDLLIALCDDQLTSDVFTLLRGRFQELACSEYGHLVVKAILQREGSDEEGIRRAIEEELVSLRTCSVLQNLILF